MENLRLECHKKLMHLSWKIIQESRRSLSKLGFTWNQYVVLKNLLPGEAPTLSEVSTRVLKENSNITPIIHFLEESELISRTEDTRDRRIIRVTLTKKGVKMREDVMAEHTQFINRTFHSFSEEELTEFIRLIEIFEQKVHGALEE